MWRILGTYRGKTEEIDTVETEQGKAEALRLLAEYQMAFGRDWALELKEASE